ncbi:MAG: hypothetical protein KGD57_03785 [Candidatus Lokiarchaeota archaeon]|nr:hypothetical protein [Candidatus Lokiarchaeota archaeon]
MSDWATQGLEWIEYYWGQFADWFLAQPLFAQILFVVLICTMIVLAAILVYYIIKGVAYLLYYLAKGIYHLLKAIGLGLYKLFKGIYKKIQGRPNQPVPPYQSPQNYNKPHINDVNSNYNRITVKTPSERHFCSVCGKQYSTKVNNLLKSKGSAFCEYCGENLNTNPIEIEI